MCYHNKHIHFTEKITKYNSIQTYMKKTIIYPVIRHISPYILQNAIVLVTKLLLQYCNLINDYQFRKRNAKLNFGAFCTKIVRAFVYQHPQII